VVDSLGDPQGPKSKVLASRNETSVADYVKLEDLALLLERSTAGNAKRR